MASSAIQATIASRLRDVAGDSYGAVKDFAAATGYDYDSVKGYLRGSTRAPHDFLVAVADEFHVSMDWLYGREPADTQKSALPLWARRMERRITHLEEQVGQLPDKAYADKVGDTAAKQVIDALTADEVVERVASALAGRQ